MDIEPAAIADWLLRTTWQVAVLVAVVGAVHLLVGRRLAPRWRFALWGLVVVRLLLPVIPASPWSVFNLSPGVMIAAGPHASSEGTPALAAGPFGGSPGVVAPVEPQDPDAAALPKQPLDLGDAAPDRKASPVAVPPAPRLVDATQSASVATSALRPPDEGRPFDWRFALLLAWLAGAAFVAARVVIGTEVLRRKLRTATAPDGDVLALLDRCRREMDVTGPLPALVTDAVAGPALFGFARPRLLLPPALLRELSRADLRFVFLHELAHLKRRDPLTNAALLVAGAMHWFNPLARLALARCRAERELACDELVMQATAPDACPAYGRVVLRVAETLCAARVRGPVGAGGAASLVLAAAPAIGLIPSRSQLRRRIAMIATFRHAPRRRYRQAILPALLLLGVCSCALTDRSDDPADPPAPTVTPPTTTAPTTQPADAAAWVRTLPVDGEVVGPAKDGENVLINLGTGDQISPGLRFEVYDRAAGIPPLPTGPETAEAGDGRAGLGKASLEVVRVGRTQSECRIVRQRGPAAVVAGDVIGNVVYDKNARPVFVVAGTFHEDLVRRIIQQYGGRVTDEAGAAGDFVLLGAPPDAADGPARAAYGDARRRAAELGAPLLVEGHFLNYAGHNEDREKALADLMRTSRRRVAEARHDEALRVIDQILALDPGNEYAVGVRPLVLDKVHLRARRERA
jgi:beta-lactamase regulating signal transducer with metallopeptidase domain